MIAIIGAMDCEISLLLSAMTGVESEKTGKHTYYTGKIAGHDCVLVRCGVGKVNAATAATVIIEKYRPSVIINIGVGGGLAPDLSVGEMIAATALCTHDLDYGVIGDARGTVFYPDDEELIMLPTDRSVTDLLVSTAASLGIACRRGIIASGDKFVSSSEARADIRGAFGADVCEMEGATKWECFWKVTFPMLSPMLMVNLIYSITDSFTSYSNPVMRLIVTTVQEKMKFAYSSALAWVYFAVIGAILAIVFLIVSRKIVYVD